MSDRTLNKETMESPHRTFMTNFDQSQVFQQLLRSSHMGMLKSSMSQQTSPRETLD